MFQYNLPFFCEYKRFIDKYYINAYWMNILKIIPNPVNLTGISKMFIDKSAMLKKSVKCTEICVNFEDILCCHYFNLWTQQM